MKKGSSARKCRCCGKVVGWIVPTGKDILGIRVCEFKPTKDLSVNRHGYICKECDTKQ